VYLWLDIRDWAGELSMMDELDLSQVLIPELAKDHRGEKGFELRMMSLLLLYAYCVGIVS
jgi:hypothetical protein